MIATLALAGASCSDSTTAPPPAGDGASETGDGTSKTGDGTSKTGDGTSKTGDGPWSNNQPACNGKIYACSDGVDNDKDGKIDAQDPECVGPCDDDEASFATGIPGDNVDACKQDCFFDGNSGQGDDRCEWNLKCDPKNPGKNLSPKACPYDPKYRRCPKTQAAKCIKACRGLTPNGCDCFGCCEVWIKGKTRLIFLGSGSGCSVSAADKCASCTQSTDCNNDCGECELCLGKTISDLPAKCFPAPQADGGVAKDAAAPPPRLPTCTDNLTPCLSNSGCPSGMYCVTGCCIKGIN